MDYLPISALQHLLFCERQCALIHIDREWSENRFTAEGRVLHERVHHGPSERRPLLRIARGLSVISHTLRLTGECDVVEFHRNGRILPVEYKRGTPKAHRADEVQLCAQSIALEEMLNVTIPEGALFYGTPRRRTTVLLDDELRTLTRQLAQRLHTLLQSGTLPPAAYHRSKCGACSLVLQCQPRATTTARWHTTLQQILSDAPAP